MKVTFHTSFFIFILLLVFVFPNTYSLYFFLFLKKNEKV